METIVPLLMVILIGSGALVLYMARHREELSREAALNRRIQVLVPLPVASVGAKSQQARAQAQQGGHPLVIAWDPLRELERWLAQAGLEVGATRFMLMIMLLGLGGTISTGLWLDSKMAAVYGLGFAALPVGYLVVRRKRRLATVCQQLPYILDFMRSALSAGHTLLRGVQMAADNSPEPMATELRAVVDQIRLGASLPDALDNMFRRVPEDSLGFLVAAVRVQADVGSSIAEILDRVTTTIRDRQRLQQEIKSLTAQARMSGMIVSALPFALLALFTLIRPAYTHPLFHDPLGIMMLEAAVVLDVIALLFIRHMVQVD
jgi:tight adherence protein B